MRWKFLQREKNTPNIPHILCLGGGYVGIYLTKALRSQIKACKIKLTVVDQDNFQCFHGLIPDMITGKIQPMDTLSPSRRLFQPADFINAEVEEINLEKKQVRVARFLDRKHHIISYDHLVLGLGATEHLGSFPGLAEHSFRLKAYAGCFAVRNHLISMLELADIEKDPIERQQLLTFVVVGGNYAGVEVAGELREFLPKVAKRHFRHIPLTEIKVKLVASSEHILPELGSHMPNQVQWAEKLLMKDPHFELISNTRLVSATMDEVVLSNNRRISTSTIISCTGTATSPIIEKLGLERNPQGRVVANQFGRVKGQENIWAGGDCASVPMANGNPAPSLAIYAMTIGTLIGKNILRQIKGAPLKPYTFNGLGDAAILGYRKAVGHVKGIPVRGIFAWLIWRFMMILYLPSREKKIRVMWEWMMAPFFGRNLINMRTQQPLDLTPILFEDGQDIVKEGEIGNSLFIVNEGVVDVWRTIDGVETHLETLTKGRHFGEIYVFNRRARATTIRAKGRVKVFQVRSEAAIALCESFTAFNQTGNFPEKRRKAHIRKS